MMVKILDRVQGGAVCLAERMGKYIARCRTGGRLSFHV